MSERLVELRRSGSSPLAICVSWYAKLVDGRSSTKMSRHGAGLLVVASLNHWLCAHDPAAAPVPRSVLQVIVCSACSGHGFKLSSTVGSILA